MFFMLFGGKRIIDNPHYAGALMERMVWVVSFFGVSTCSVLHTVIR